MGEKKKWRQISNQTSIVINEGLRGWLCWLYRTWWDTEQTHRSRTVKIHSFTDDQHVAYLILYLNVNFNDYQTGRSRSAKDDCTLKDTDCKQTSQPGWKKYLVKNTFTLSVNPSQFGTAKCVNLGIRPKISSRQRSVKSVDDMSSSLIHELSQATASIPLSSIPVNEQR